MTQQDQNNYSGMRHGHFLNSSGDMGISKRQGHLICAFLKFDIQHQDPCVGSPMWDTPPPPPTPRIKGHHSMPHFDWVTSLSLNYMYLLDINYLFITYSYRPKTLLLTHPLAFVEVLRWFRFAKWQFCPTPSRFMFLFNYLVWLQLVHSSCFPVSQ